MPIYEYHCLTCGHNFEKLVYAQAAVGCPECTGLDVMRRLSLFRSKSGRSAAVSSTRGSGGGCGCGAGGCGCH